MKIVSQIMKHNLKKFSFKIIKISIKFISKINFQKVHRTILKNNLLISTKIKEIKVQLEINLLINKVMHCF
jgi:hypothetical protein